MTKYGIAWYDKFAPQPEGTERKRCYILAVGPPFEPLEEIQRREVVLMGNGRWAKALRFLVCAVITILVMLLTTPKAC